jgi:hypothetical protein
MEVGFTGTREGMSSSQKIQLYAVLVGFGGMLGGFHFGGQVGADVEAAAVLERLKRAHPARFGPVEIVCHPCPGVVATRETSKAWTWREVFPPLTRNQHIINETQILIAAPRSNVPELRSGTWATIRRAQERLMPVVMLSRGTLSERRSRRQG